MNDVSDLLRGSKKSRVKGGEAAFSFFLQNTAKLCLNISKQATMLYVFQPITCNQIKSLKTK